MSFIELTYGFTALQVRFEYFCDIRYLYTYILRNKQNTEYKKYVREYAMLQNIGQIYFYLFLIVLFVHIFFIHAELKNNKMYCVLLLFVQESLRT